MYTKKQRIISFVACAAFVLATLCSVLFLVKEANHACTGDNCPICAAIEIAENTIRNLSNGIIPTDSGFTAVNVFFRVILICCMISFSHSTLITQKVRLND